MAREIKYQDITYEVKLQKTQVRHIMQTNGYTCHFYVPRQDSSTSEICQFS